MKSASVWAAIVILTATGCASGAGSGASSTSASLAPSVSESSPYVWPTASSIPYAASTLVAGTESCGLDDGKMSTDADGTEHYRGGSATCSVTNTDPRVAGGAIYTWEKDVWPTNDGYGQTQWGAGRLENAGGAWVGTYTGIATSETGDILTFWYTGTGGYKGLSYYMWFTVHFTETGQTHGLIFPGTPPKP